MPYSGSHSTLYFVSCLFVLHTQEQKDIPISPFSLLEEVSSGLPVKTGKHYTSNQPQIRHNNKGQISNKVMTSSHYEAG